MCVTQEHTSPLEARNVGIAYVLLTRFSSCQFSISIHLNYSYFLCFHRVESSPLTAIKSGCTSHASRKVALQLLSSAGFAKKKYTCTLKAHGVMANTALWKGAFMFLAYPKYFMMTITVICKFSFRSFILSPSSELYNSFFHITTTGYVSCVYISFHSPLFKTILSLIHFLHFFFKILSFFFLHYL